MRDLYGIEDSPDLTSTITNAVLMEVAAWQHRLLQPACPTAFFGAIRVKIRDESMVRNSAIQIGLTIPVIPREFVRNTEFAIHQRMHY